MDTGLLNLGEEHFSTYYVQEEYESSGHSSGDNRSYFNDWEDERELNGDIGLIPESSSFCETLKDMTDFTDSPGSIFLQRMLDWSTLIYVDGVETFPHESSISDPELKENVINTFNEKEITKFDLTKYITEPDPPAKSVKAPVKKIDLEAQKYIVDDNSSDDVIDVETVEGSSLPVLEATDAFSLLEQFEASEKPLANKNSVYNFTDSLVSQISNSSIEMFEKIPQTPINIFEEEEDVKMDFIKIDPALIEDIKIEPEIMDDVKFEPEIVENVEMRKEDNVEICVKKEKVKVKLPAPKQAPEAGTYVKNKQIMDALPQELIARINESGKRKTITVIPPIPNKKRGNSRSVETVSQHKNKVPKVVANEQVHFDHDYCASISPYPKDPHKDSGFQSSEEDDRSVIRNQPTVKNADGKLMVSLLKVNTIRSNNQKKKLNLEEYKRRRLINSNATSQSNSPASSTCSSPLPEDDYAKRVKHQEKLMKMAADLLNTTAKSAKPNEPLEVKQPPVQLSIPRTVAKVVPPPDLEVKTYVSIGTNTDISSINCSKNVLASAKQLEEIKPLLKKVSDKINSNSFITSLIENIPKMKTKSGPRVVAEGSEGVHEDKVIHYLKKDRQPVKTNSVEVQTDFDFVGEDTQSRYRRRIDGGDRSPSCSSGSNSSNYRRRRDSSSSSQKSCSSSSSGSSSSSSRSSRSRTRSQSPRKKRPQNGERLLEVEERRVIYVGRITKGTTKEDLRRRFQLFGIITNISLHFRDYGDNYGFVTFANKEDAYEAVEHGNDGHSYPKYDLSFGGRRIFCQTSYSDLDNMREDDYNYHTSRAPDNSFDALLRAAQEKLRNRKP